MIGEKLKLLRENLGKDQLYIANKLGVARSTYADYEVNIRTPSIKTLCDLVLFYNCNLDYILNRNNSKKPYGKIRRYSKETFIRNIKIIRKNLHLTQEEISKLFSCNVSTITRYETGVRTIQIGYLIELSNLSNIPTDYIVGIVSKKH